MINRERIVEKFLEYVQIDSETKNEKEFAEKIKGELEELGFSVYIDKAGEKVGSNTGNVIAKLEGNKDAEPILFSAHMDTVTPGIGIKPVIKDEVIYSDGTTILGSDDKAGIAAVIEAVKVLKEENIDHGNIEVVFSIYEEGGLYGAKNLEYDKIEAKRAFVLDSGGSPGEIIIKGPAQDKLVAKIIGTPAHAGVCPEEGISAIQVAAAAIAKMNLLRIDEETTANIGIIEGGKATNIVCPEVTITGEARSLVNEKLDKQTGHMVECIEKACEEFGAKAEIETPRAYSAFSVDENDEIVKLVKKACDILGFEATTKASGGGSDTNILNGNGIKAINLGVGMKKVHTLEEYISIDDLTKTAKLVLEIIKNA
ncbi:M20/M25/M40 family metallo-hydrolase [Anaeromicrobium sediminis]|uniref:Peptidase M20 n=1 Tax=Anaeromicrobium sediminis TaxID=1478221 RepID=A0A267MM15_9FIRM|nr:M20/M25/M40 family metallo-hydrolase [Anaeromicrobium sediminis]PAB59948.1 peptidase M20 [Anaeromicrobium sediminis]